MQPKYSRCSCYNSLKFKLKRPPPGTTHGLGKPTPLPSPADPASTAARQVDEAEEEASIPGTV